DRVAKTVPVERFVKVKAKPVPASSVRTTLPFLSLNSLKCRFPPNPSICRSKVHAVPAGNTRVKSGLAAAAAFPHPSPIATMPPNSQRILNVSIFIIFLQVTLPKRADTITHADRRASGCSLPEVYIRQYDRSLRRWLLPRLIPPVLQPCQ